MASSVNVKDASDPTRASIHEVCSALAPLEPEFILKVERSGEKREILM